MVLKAGLLIDPLLPRSNASSSSYSSQWRTPAWATWPCNASAPAVTPAMGKPVPALPLFAWATELIVVLLQARKCGRQHHLTAAPHPFCLKRPSQPQQPCHGPGTPCMLFEVCAYWRGLTVISLCSWPSWQLYSARRLQLPPPRPRCKPSCRRSQRPNLRARLKLPTAHADCQVRPALGDAKLV